MRLVMPHFLFQTQHIFSPIKHVKSFIDLFLHLFSLLPKNVLLNHIHFRDREKCIPLKPFVQTDHFHDFCFSIGIIVIPLK